MQVSSLHEEQKIINRFLRDYMLENVGEFGLGNRAARRRRLGSAAQTGIGHFRKRNPPGADDRCQSDAATRREARRRRLSTASRRDK